MRSPIREINWRTRRLGVAFNFIRIEFNLLVVPIWIQVTPRNHNKPWNRLGWSSLIISKFLSCSHLNLLVFLSISSSACWTHFPLFNVSQIFWKVKGVLSGEELLIISFFIPQTAWVLFLVKTLYRRDPWVVVTVLYSMSRRRSAEGMFCKHSLAKWIAGHEI